MTDTSKAFKLRYVGARFEGGRLPLDVLTDLPAFRDLIAALAKDAWLADNGHRKRVPKGFEETLSFDLVGVQEGSAIPEIVWRPRVGQTSLPGLGDAMTDLVGRSYAVAASIFDDATRPRALSGGAIRALNKFGASLRDGERIEFTGARDRTGNVLYIDFAKRKRIITQATETYETRIQGIGILVANDSQVGQITIETEEHGLISVPLDSDEIVETFDGSLRSNVEFDLLVEMDHNDKVKTVVSIVQIDLLEALTADQETALSRISDLKKLAEGWHDGDGMKIADNASVAAEMLLLGSEQLASKARIFPTVAGGVLLEFEAAGWDFSVECLPDSKVEFYGVEIDGDAELEPLTFAGPTQAFFKEINARAGW